MIDGEHVPVNITWFFWWVGERGIAFGFEEEADSMVVGYSGTPLHKKLGFKPGAHVALVDVAEDVRAELADAVAQCQLVKTGNGPLDLGILTVTTQFQLRKAFASWKKQLTQNGALWISWPKKSSGVASDLDENKVREIGLAIGLVDVKVCAVSDVWSGLKFVIPVKDRK
ncbi:MAG TPA: hypothetical protein VHR84_11195 [Terriglobales bacterium]|jgi:hypothetical protein|nr:hypothetical protein [Terriglobales bacterium]